MTICRKCGAPLEADARFCPRCGTAVAAPPARHHAWWLVPAAIIGVVLITWLVLAGLPFGRTEQVRRTPPPATETIAEGTASRPSTATLIDLPPDEFLPPATTTTITAASPPAVIVEERPPAAPLPPPMASASAEISEGEASSTLSRFLASRNPYPDVSRDCIELRGDGYRNAGYAFSAWDACVRGGGSRRLGRWRVDATTRDVFKQQADGRYQRP